MLVVSYNPGYQNLLKGLKPSTRQRFVAMSFDYPNAEIECSIIEQESGVSRATAQQLVELAHALRSLQGVDLEEGVSTRLLVYCAGLMKSGLDSLSAARAAIIEPLSDDADTIAALYQVAEACLGH